MYEQPVIYVPMVTYQYGAEGNLDPSMLRPSLPFDTDIRERFKEWTIAQYPSHPQTWSRLSELVAGKLAALPDNPFVLEDAWLCGIIEDGGPHVKARFDQLSAFRQNQREEEEARLARETERQSLEAELSVKVLGKTSTAAKVEVTSRATGETLSFTCRNIFDVGYVINPNYAIAPGLKPGGIVNKGEWMTYTEGRGWEAVRPLTDFEKQAYRYLSHFSPIDTAIRM